MPFKVMSRQCDQCLYSKNKIVSDNRRRQIIRKTIEDDNHFICHKATIAGQDVACRGHYDVTGGGRLGRMAKYLGVIKEVDPESVSRETVS